MPCKENKPPKVNRIVKDLIALELKTESGSEGPDEEEIQQWRKEAGGLPTTTL